MAKRSPYAKLAEEYLKEKAPDIAIPTKHLWAGLRERDPALTEATPNRKTPRNTCMRDLRKDEAFILGKGKVRLKPAETESEV
jgi:hypothetical protein